MLMRTTFISLDAKRFEQNFRDMPNSIPLTKWQEILSRSNDVMEVAEILSELDLSEVVSKGDYVTLPKSVAPIVLEVCQADCMTAQYQILYTDFFFADLEASRPNIDGLNGDALSAWETFLKLADLSNLFRSYLPWWLQAAATQRNCFTGLLNPLEVHEVNAHRELLLPVINNGKDADGLFQVISDADISGDWVLCLEPGT